jgi:hypothetical protein
MITLGITESRKMCICGANAMYVGPKSSGCACGRVEPSNVAWLSVGWPPVQNKLI